MNMLFQGSVWPFLVLAWPLFLGLVPVLPVWRDQAPLILPLAPLPALGLALMGAPGGASIPDLLLGVELVPAPGGTLLLGMTAMVWTVAGWQAALSIGRGPQAGILTGFWCLTLAGNLGVFLAGDVVTFYTAFAAVSLAAWFLVIHDRSPEALAAGRVYIALAVLGEAALLAGLLIGAEAAGSLQIGAVRTALSEAPLGGAALALLITGFGIKAGMVPLHVWLPLAHAAAPAPGSAVLSGAIVKAGLIGMVLFVPPGGGWGLALVWVGFAGAFAAALWGLTQRNPKAVLAYSTISQIGLMLVLAGTGSGMVAFYALHHGLAKGALFLLAGVLAMAHTPARRRAGLLLAIVVAASVAGLPLTGGALAKLAAKEGLAPVARTALGLSGVTTALIMAWFVLLIARQQGVAGKAGSGQHPRHPFTRLLAGPLVLGLAALGAPWALWTAETGLATSYPLRPATVFEALWPLAAGLALFGLLRRRPPPEQAPGDLLNLPAPTGWKLPRELPRFEGNLPRHGARVWLRWARRRSAQPEAMLRNWPVAGSLMVGVALALAAVLTLA